MHVNNAVITPDSTAAPTTSVTWSIAAAGLWVGRVDGTCVGVIEEQWRDGFVARDAAARKVGHFKALDEAKAHFQAL